MSGSKLAVRGRGGRIRGSRAPRCVRLDRAPQCRRLRGGLNGAPAGRFLDVSSWVGVLSVESGGLEPCRCSRPARDAAPTIAPTIFCSDRLAADAGPGQRAHRRDLLRLVSGPDLDVLALVDAAPDFHKSGPMSSIRPTSWGSARNRRDRTGREAVKKAGVVLGYRASWHDRGPGGRHDDGARSRGRGHPQPQTGLDRNGS